MLKYKRTHIPTSTVWITDFNDKSLIPNHGVTKGHGFNCWVGECEAVIKQWNKMGIVNDQQIWHYELVVETTKEG